MQLEKTLVILKPDAVARGLIWEILSRLERAWFVLVACKLVQADKDLLYKHYEWIWQLWTRKWDKILNWTINMMMQNPVLACVFEWVNAVENIRKLVGPTEPKSAPAWTIRWDYAQISYAYADATWANINNLIHASATPEEAQQEVSLRFDDNEIQNYETVHCKFVR